MNEYVIQDEIKVSEKFVKEAINKYKGMSNMDIIIKRKGGLKHENFENQSGRSVYRW